MADATPAADRNAALDGLRVLAFAAVVVLHANSLGLFSATPLLGFLADEACRFAVPVFFLLSGYFWRPDDLRHPVGLALRLTRRVAPAYFLALVFYNAIGGNLPTHPGAPGEMLARLVTVLQTGGAGPHLWFLPALVLGALIAAGAVRLTGWTGGLIITGGLFLAGCLAGAYGPLWNIDLEVEQYRNGVCFAPLFLLLGHLVRRHEAALARLPLWAVAGAAGYGLLAQIAEGALLAGNFPVGHDFGLGTLPFALGILAVALRIRITSPVLEELGRAVFGAYILHLFVLTALMSLPAIIGFPLPLAVISGSIVLGLGCVLAWRRIAPSRRMRPVPVPN